ncbi:ABC transporter permease [Neomegalonema sp.]|uniref:ABC transporter permease n=1 Tax=Neomegalonema sp. TaxID=2039713 RepID=UPI00262166F3|nr:ABC transporter permease [Neomegalonema sp.]MDD2867650.1 ABC transporter permease [Neomegalonema sp.]
MTFFNLINAYAFWGAIELGLIFGLVGLGVFLTFRALDFPDLTVDGGFPLGAGVAAVLILGGWNPWLACLAALGAGALAGLATGVLAIRFGVLHILASILTMIALFSINIRVMGAPNLSLLGQETIVTPFAQMGLSGLYARPLAVGLVVLLVTGLLTLLFVSDFGLALRATGVNARMLRAQGADSRAYTYFGLALSNGLVALAGALFAQTSGFADVTSGAGTIVFGLAAVVLGETFFRSGRIWVVLTACVLGSIIYRLALAVAMQNLGSVGLQASDLNLITALIVAAALIAPKIRAEMRQRAARKGAAS